MRCVLGRMQRSVTVEPHQYEPLSAAVLLSCAGL
jgi:hypothetical protein